MEGTLETLNIFHSRFLPPRRIDVWLPASYASRPRSHYPVLYMHDGQNLFEPQYATNGETWGVAEALSSLAAKGAVPETIVVGIWNHSNRWQEYLPQRPFESDNGIATLARLSPDKTGGVPVSDRYLRFVVEELKPFIDRTYRTCPERATTSMMGSSMGGLISLYALCEYPAVFGQAGCVSTHWPALKDVALPYLRERLPAPGRHRIYFDYGTTTLDALYEPYQLKVNGLMAEKGYDLGRDWTVHKFEGAAHNEPAWRARIDVPLTFLFGASS